MKPLLPLLILINTCCFGQNLLSPHWKISCSPVVATVDSTPQKDLNLLLSWERQGFSWMDGKCTIENSFYVDNNINDLILDFSLQCDVETVYINGHPVTGNIANSFWSSNRGKLTTVTLSPQWLIPNEQNKITILLSGPGYTGGISHNTCSVYSSGVAAEEEISFDFPTPDHVYNGLVPVAFQINYNVASDGILSLSVVDDFHKQWVHKEFPVKAGENILFVDVTAYNLPAGFYECVAISSGDYYHGEVAWFAIRPEAISCDNQTTEGFDEYWQQAMDELRSVAPQFRLHRVDSLCSPSRDGYVVEMQSLGNLTIRGYYFVPKTPGKHPVVLHLPGYSYGFEHHDGFKHRKEDVAELALCVRGHGISMDVFNPWEEKTLWAVDICNPEKYVYRSIYMDCIRAVDFLLSRPEIDPDRIGVTGGSQGGALALATAGLYSNHIRACAVFDPFLTDIRHQMQIRPMVINEFRFFTTLPGNNCNTDQIISSLDYIDALGFAPKITSSFFLAAALFDDDCPPHCAFSAYNLIQAEKTYQVFPNDSHMAESDIYGKMFHELVRMLE